MPRVAIVGAGLAGLACAHRLLHLLKDDAEIVLLEASDRAGGHLRSERADGCLVEWGPNGFLDNSPPTLDLITELGLSAQVVSSRDSARRRFVFRDGGLRLLPASPGAFLRSDILSTGAKLRLALEPFARRRPQGDETIHAFAARRLGREAADMLVDPMVSGIFAGDARQLSLRASFPKMWELEEAHGGLFRALVARRRKVRAAGTPVGSPLGRLTSFADGIETLPRALQTVLGDRIRTNTRVTALASGPGGAWNLTTSTGQTVTADHIVLTGAPGVTASLILPLEQTLGETLLQIPSAPVAVIALVYAAQQVGHAMDGFGFLVPRGQGPRILGALWESSIYPGRVEGERVLIRVMAGGAHDPAFVGLDDAQALAVVRQDLQTTMGVTATPQAVKIMRHRDGIPQYTVGHLDRLARIDAAMQRLPGVHLAGHGYHGVGINRVIEHAHTVADTIVRRAR